MVSRFLSLLIVFVRVGMDSQICFSELGEHFTLSVSIVSRSAICVPNELQCCTFWFLHNLHLSASRVSHFWFTLFLVCSCFVLLCRSCFSKNFQKTVFSPGLTEEFDHLLNSYQPNNNVKIFIKFLKN
jgi:hypothetical protein